MPKFTKLHFTHLTHERKVKNGEKSPWGQCLTRPVPNGSRCYAFWLGRKTQKFSGTNQKSEWRRPFGTVLVRHCPQGLFSQFFIFLRAIFSRLFRLSLTPLICPWVSEDVFFSMICACLHKKTTARGKTYIIILQHMLVNFFKAQSFNNYNLAQNKIQPTSFRKKGWSSANTKTHHLSIPHFTERKEDLNFPSILFKIVFSAHFSTPCPHYLEQSMTYQSSQVCGASFRVIFP